MLMKKERNIFMKTPPDSSKNKKTLHELAKEFPEKTYRELEKYREEDRQQEAGICIIGEARKDREITEPDWHPDGVTFKEKYEKEHKLRQEAEGELTIIKGIGSTSPEMVALKKEVKNLKWIKDHDYIFLIDENKKLRAEIKKLKGGTVDRARKAGL